MKNFPHPSLDPTSVLPSVQAGEGPDRSDVRQRSRGFALLITITLLAFLVLLLVSLAALTRVETQVASNNQQLSQARQNALMALNIALGELQKYTGPDQRTTARSDMDATLANTTTSSGRWLGAYGSGAPADYAMEPSAISDTVVAASDTRGSQAKLLNWLVSGNENTAFDPSSHVGATGNISTPPPSSSFQFTPDGTVSGLAVGSTALTETITIADKNGIAQPARLLVGAHTAGASPADYVVAPLKEVTAEATGLGTTPVPVGRYAWWVGDEGSKARFDLPMSTASQAPHGFVSAQRAAVELVDAVNPSASTSLAAGDMLDPAGALSRYNPAATGLTQLLSPDQFPLLSTTDAATLRQAIQYRYHDLTAYSSSVLSDTYAGGMKKDLSAVLATGATTPADTDFIFTPKANTGSSSHEFGLPTWGQLRDHVRTFSSSAGLDPRFPVMTKLSTFAAPTPTSIGISPVMTYANLGFAYGVPQTETAPFDQAGNPIRLALFPVVVLWNPYTTSINPSKYVVGFRKYFDAKFELQASRPNPPGGWDVLNSFDMDGNRYLRFVIDAPAIPAGQSLVFTLGQNGVTYSPANTSNPLTHGFRPGNHVLVNPSATDLPKMVVSTPGRTYRVGVNGRNGTSDSGLPVPKTFFGNTTAHYGRGTTGVCYLSPVGAPAPDNELPYKGSNFSSWQWYQCVTALGTSNNISPYGTNVGYARHQDANGLMREEGDIDMIVEPSFRLSFRMQFKDSRYRWIAQANPHAFMMSRPSSPTGSGGVVNWTLEPTDTSWPNDLAVLGSASAPRASAGLTLNHSGTNPVDVTLFEFRPDNQPLLTIGQLQHANLAWLSSYPAYAIGNSLGATFFDNAKLGTHPAALMLVTNPTGAYDLNVANRSSAFYDLSWLLNHALWDRYFVSTVPHPGSGTAADAAVTQDTDVPPVLPNPRHTRLGDPDKKDLKSADRAAAMLMLKGGFNINSTSEQAWRAVLGGTHRLAYDPETQSTGGTPLQVVFPRFAKPIAGAPAVIDNDNAWLGYRTLGTDQIANLARNIVSEIRRRGPSISLADFINRRLTHAINPDGTDPFPRQNDKRIKGAIQAAIEMTATGVGAINDAATIPYADPLVSEKFNNPVTNAFKAGEAVDGAPSIAAPYSATAAFSPQYVTQADVLSTIGSGLSARSDTFVIRTYGETINPVLSPSSPGYISGRAWCEAVVQRLPEYLDTVANPNAYEAPVSAINRQMGRRYKIVSFRWLTPNDI